LDVTQRRSEALMPIENLSNMNQRSIRETDGLQEDPSSWKSEVAAAFPEQGKDYAKDSTPVISFI
jgi:hypothetical protein